jgi:glycosyltransferase involved in cell wall biosynthesis
MREGGQFGVKSNEDHGDASKTSERRTLRCGMITIILCTYNRCESLAKALESVANSELPETLEWEVLVVDNNSPDGTAKVVEDFRSRYPNRFRYLFERQQGKSYALNSGIRNARGDLLVFMDDDVTVEPTWLRNLTAPLSNNHDYAGSGGRILPEKSFLPPRWLPVHERYGLAPLAVFDLGRENSELSEPPFGTNMAFRKKVFEKYGGFRTDLGPQPGSEIRNEDTEFGRRLLTAGERLCYEASAVVYHSVPQHRVRKKYFLRWSFDKGRANILEYGIREKTKLIVGGVPLYLFGRLTVWTLRWMLTLEPSRRFSCRLKMWTIAGAILESYRNPQIERNADDKKSTAVVGVGGR